MRIRETSVERYSGIRKSVVKWETFRTRRRWIGSVTPFENKVGCMLHKRSVRVWWLKPIYLVSHNLSACHLPFSVPIAVSSFLFPLRVVPMVAPGQPVFNFLTSVHPHVRVTLHSNVSQYVTLKLHISSKGRRTDIHSLTVSLFAPLCRAFPRMEPVWMFTKSWSGQKLYSQGVALRVDGYMTLAHTVNGAKLPDQRLHGSELHERRLCNPCFWEVEIRNSQDAEARQLVSAIIPAAYQTLTTKMFPCTIPAVPSQPTLPRREHQPAMLCGVNISWRIEARGWVRACPCWSGAGRKLSHLLPYVISGGAMHRHPDIPSSRIDSKLCMS